MSANLQQIQPNALVDQANWCLRTMRDCTDPELTAELAFIGTALLNKALRKNEAAETRH